MKAQRRSAAIFAVGNAYHRSGGKENPDRSPEERESRVSAHYGVLRQVTGCQTGLNWDQTICQMPAAVVFAALLSVVVQTSSQTTLAVGVHTVVWPVSLSGICVRLRFRHVELIQVVSDCWDRSDKPQKSD
ncbi:hypothetical protein ABVT39_024768 [Epinephelus coioides]